MSLSWRHRRTASAFVLALGAWMACSADGPAGRDQHRPGNDSESASPGHTGVATVTHTEDTGAAGSTDSGTTVQCRLGRETLDLDPGNPRLAEDSRFEYDEVGRLVSIVSTRSFPDGKGGWTYVDWHTEQVYDANGSLVLKSVDKTGDLNADDAWVWTYDSRGRVYTEAFLGAEPHLVLYDYDGRVTNVFWDYALDAADDHFRYTYNEIGQLVSRDWDYLSDSSWDGRTEWTYNAQGSVLTETYDSFLTFSDYERTYRYNDRGFLQEEEYWHGPPANPVCERWTWQYYPDGAPSAVSWDLGCTGGASTRDSYFYDEAGNLVRVEYTSIPFTELDAVLTQTFDDRGNPLSWRLRNQGRLVEEWTWEYDCS